MIEINLIPDVKQELIRARMIRSTVVSTAIVITIGAAALVVILAIYVFGVQTVRSAVADDSIKKGSSQLSSVQDLSKILTIQNQLTKLNALNDAKSIDSRVFDMLQAVIPPAPNAVKISSLVVDAGLGTIKLEGQTPLYPSLETFRKTLGLANVRFKDADGKQTDIPFATNLSLTNVSFGDDVTGTKVVRFDITFTYATELLSPTITNPTIVLIDGGNVTDSYLGIPKSIFTDRATDTGGTK